MTWWLHAQIGRESICYPLDEQAADLGPTAGEGLDFDDSASATPPWSGGGLEFSLVGDGPSFDLGVADPVGGASLVVTDADITMATFCYVASLDCALLVEGDPGTTISRSVILLPMAKVRQGLAGGKDEISVGDLDLERVRGASNGMDLAMARWSFVSTPDTREVFAYANTPRVQPAVALISLVDYRGMEPGGVNTGIAALVKGGHELPGIWLTDVISGRLQDGRLRAMAVGVVRKRRDFLLGLRVLTANDEDESLYVTLRDSGFVERDVYGVELRDGSSVKAVAALPDLSGCLVVVEDPFRTERLYRVDVSEGGVSATEIELEDMPSRIRVTAEAPGQSADAAQVDSDDPDEDLVTVGKSGCQVALGELAADAWPVLSVVVVGDGASAGLQWWLSQAEGEQVVAYTLHLRASRDVRVRYALKA